MCYICQSYSGHEVGCPFAETEERTYTCIECNKEVCEEDVYDYYSDDKCLCSECSKEVI